MFKSLALAKFENLGDAGGWQPLCKIDKQQGQMTAAWVDKVRISFILEGDTGGTSSEKLGYLFAVTNKATLSGTDSDNSPYIISASASRGGGGVVTLPVKRRVMDNDFDETTGFGALQVHVRATDTGSETPALTMVIETWGRWHQVTAN